MPYVSDLRIDGNLIAGIDSIEADFEEAAAQTTADGGEVTTTRTKGATIRLRIQPGREPGLYAALVAARNGLVPHTLTFDDPDGDSYSFDVNWKAKPPIRIGLPGYFNAITIALTERA